MRNMRLDSRADTRAGLPPTTAITQIVFGGDSGAAKTRTPVPLAITINPGERWQIIDWLADNRLLYSVTSESGMLHGLYLDGEGGERPISVSPTSDPTMVRFCESVEKAHSSHSDAGRIAEHVAHVQLGIEHHADPQVLLGQGHGAQQQGKPKLAIHGAIKCARCSQHVGDATDQNEKEKSHKNGDGQPNADPDKNGSHGICFCDTLRVDQVFYY